MKDIHSFLGHASFYRRFIKNFTKIIRPLTSLLAKDVPFIFDDECLNAWEKLKMELIFVPIISAPDWSKLFEIMCDASDFAIGVVLGQRIDNKQHVIHYSSRTLNDTPSELYYNRERILGKSVRIGEILPIPTWDQDNYLHRPLAIRYLMLKKDAKA